MFVNFVQQIEVKKCTILKEMSKRRAVPLCLPNNCKWDEQTGEYSKDGEDRKLLCVIEAALRNLRSIKGSNCTLQ